MKADTVGCRPPKRGWRNERFLAAAHHHFTLYIYPIVGRLWRRVGFTN